MPKNRFLGVVLLCGGVYLLWLTVQTADRNAGAWFEQIMNGSLSDQALIYLVGGGVLSIVGLIMVQRR